MEEENLSSLSMSDVEDSLSSLSMSDVEDSLSSLSMSDVEDSLSSLSMSGVDESDAIINSLLPQDIIEEEEGENVVEVFYKLKYQYGFDNNPCESSFGKAEDLIEDVMSNEFILAVNDGSFKNVSLEYNMGDETMLYKGEDCISFLQTLSKTLAENPNPDGDL